jgi:hypothetical protein
VNDILRQTREGIEDEDSFQLPDTSRPLKSYLPKGVFSHPTIELSSALTFLDPAKHSRSEHLQPFGLPRPKSGAI